MTFFFRLLSGLRRYLRLSGSSLVVVFAGTLLLDVLFGLLFYLAESPVQKGLTLGDSIWWAMVTMTTVGYGDYYPKTFAGRFLIAWPTMIIGIGVVGYLIGVIADFVLSFSLRKRRGLMDIFFKNHVVICNYPSEEKVVRVASEIKANEDYRKANFVLVTDKLEELPEVLKKEGFTLIYGSPTCEDILKKAKISESSGVIVLSEKPGEPSSDEKNFAIGSLVELIEKELGRSIKSVIEVTVRSNVKLMNKINVDGIVLTDGLASSLLAQEFSFPGVNNIFGQVITNKEGSQFYLHDTILTGFKILDLQIAALNHEANIQVIGLVRGNEQILNPPRDLVLRERDQLVFLSENNDEIEKFEQYAKKKLTSHS